MPRLRRLPLAAVLLFALCLPTIASAEPLSQRPVSALKTPSFARCSAMQRKYPTGIARDSKAAARSVKSGHATPRVSKTLYEANKGLDRDGDGVACEVSA